MKKLKLIAVLIAFSAFAYSASAQVGIEAGYQNLGYSMKGNGLSHNSSLNGFYVGVSDEIRIVAGLGVHVGLNYSFATDKSAKTLFDELSMKGGSEKAHYLNVPLRVRYAFNIVPKILKIQVYAGPVFSVGLSHTQNFDYAAEIGGDTYGGQISYNYYTGKFKSGDFNDELSGVLPTYKRFEAALGGGVGVELFRLIEVKAGYDWGLTERSKQAEMYSSKRNIFYVTLGFRF